MSFSHFYKCMTMQFTGVLLHLEARCITHAAEVAKHKTVLGSGPVVLTPGKFLPPSGVARICSAQRHPLEEGRLWVARRP